MTGQDLAAIEYRLGMTTPGPWRIDTEDTYDPQEVGICSDKGDPRLAYTRWDHFVVCYGDEDKPRPGHEVALANATFIAHSRTDVEELLAEVQRLKRELEHAKINLNEQIAIARVFGAESMRSAIATRMQSMWDRGAANIVAAVPVPDTF